MVIVDKLQKKTKTPHPKIIGREDIYSFGGGTEI